MIQSHPDAQEGSVSTLSPYEPSSFAPTDAILCRTTAPLISFAFSLIRKDIGCRVLGREIGQGLIKTIKACKTDDLQELEQKLIRMREREIAKARAAFSESAEAAAEDKYDCLNLFLNASSSVEDLIRRIETLFDDKAKGLLTLSTVHKAKGMEWETVFILDKHLMPSKWAKQPWQQVQERNLQYVATTRAKLHLKYIRSNDWKKETPKCPECGAVAFACNHSHNENQIDEERPY